MNDSKGEFSYFGAAFWQIGNAWKRNAIAVLKPHNITIVQFLILDALSRMQSKQKMVSQVEIAETLHANPMVVSSVVRSLKKQGMLKVKEHPKDSRAKQVKLTPAGIRVLAHSQSLIKGMEIQFFEPISENQSVFMDRLFALVEAHPFTVEM